jgi:hypothetical protein
MTIPMRNTGSAFGKEGRAALPNKKIKWCSKCKENHPSTWFRPDLERPDGLDNRCSVKLRMCYEEID